MFSEHSPKILEEGEEGDEEDTQQNTIMWTLDEDIPAKNK